ncbi:MAG: glycosyltransferase family 39 protein [Lewinella sp.]
MRYRPWIVFLLFLTLSVLLRWGTFSASVINHDESTYIVGADELLRGEVYLRDVIDTKPVGIFWLYALLIKLTGGSIWMLRLSAATFVALGAWLLSIVARRATGKATAGLVAGAVYTFMCSVYTYYGISPNTEIFFNVFTISAVAVSVVADLKRWWLAGLLLGLGFIIKPFVAAEALAIGLYMIWWYRREPVMVLTKGLQLVGGFAVPIALVGGYFAYQGLLPQLWFYTFEVAGAYPIDLPWYLRLKYMGDYVLRYSPFILLGAVAQVRGRFGKHAPWLTYLALQAILVTIVVLLTGKRFGHYQVQLHPVAALYVGTCVGLLWDDKLRRRRWIGSVVFIAGMLIGIGHGIYYAKKDDEARRIAAYLAPLLQAGETYFAVNGFQITYHLLDRPTPTPYIHSSLLFYDHHVRAFQIDEAKEADRVVSDRSVTYLVRRTDDPEVESLFGRRITRAFEPLDTIDGGVEIWQRKK